MKQNCFEKLVYCILNNMFFSEKVLIKGEWDRDARVIPPGSQVKLHFFFFKKAKRDVQEIMKLNGLKLLENITLSTHINSFRYFEQMREQEEETYIQTVSRWVTLRNDFGNFHSMLRLEELVSILDYTFCSLNLPPRCAVLLPDCPQKIDCGSLVDVLLVFEDEYLWILNEKIEEVDCLEVSWGSNLDIMCIDYSYYEEALSGEVPSLSIKRIFDAIVLYDAFRGIRLDAPFINHSQVG
ncbi:hypothetical protein [Parabacteroides pacaensis]|uniref:hypothetical protein n=1 Tax=Parabacteroides pacaensis TaxID=2086575 RepID=UPI00131D93F3|nr:hypothetical protein [Parabacteroides pacaensis]